MLVILADVAVVMSNVAVVVAIVLIHSVHVHLRLERLKQHRFRKRKGPLVLLSVVVGSEQTFENVSFLLLHNVGVGVGVYACVYTRVCMCMHVFVCACVCVRACVRAWLHPESAFIDVSIVPTIN